ncbi:metalloregulator ArsR/SmtB family transcription factor [Sphingorhabdus sp. EL138]|uniref:ArsR/SmtB family transcription factor n=1 Tax=Sphingorhabdus sp. EL138 TaxID=2073156 RepID=UPI000D699411|nr:metalloregulator ArsR/SmtB family transcription factor [Sphingorhabdus sp. EL138]
MFEQLSMIAKSIGNPHRLAIMEALLEGEKTVDRLAEQTGLTIGNTSQHLQQLKQAGLVQFRKDGKHSFYRVGEGPIGPLLNALQAFSDFRLRQFAPDSNRTNVQIESVGREELIARIKSKDVLLLDVRPETEYALGCLPGAINIPIDELQDRIGQLPKSVEVVAYCRGPLCSFSKEATAALRMGGFKARCFEESVPLWQAAGLPIDQAA